MESKVVPERPRHHYSPSVLRPPTTSLQMMQELLAWAVDSKVDLGSANDHELARQLDQARTKASLQDSEIRRLHLEIEQLKGRAAPQVVQKPPSNQKENLAPRVA